MKIEFKKDIYYLLLIAVILIFIWTGFMDDFRISNLLRLGLIMMVVPFLTLLRGWYGIKVYRILPNKRIYAGQRVEVILEANNSLVIPFIWLKIVDKYPIKYMMKHKDQDQASSSLNFLVNGSKRVKYELYDVPRGKLTWSKINVFRTDILGFISLSKDQEIRQQLLIYPRFVDVDLSKFLNKDESQGITRVVRGNDYSQISGVRDYERGDKLSLIHWKASARKSSLMSKEFFPLLNQEAHILMDCDSSNYPGDYNKDFELAVSIAASLAHKLAKHEKGLLLRLNNRQKETVTFKNNSYFLNKVMDTLAVVEANGIQPLERLLNHHYLNDNKRVTLFIITNKINEKILNKLFLGSGQIRAQVFLVGNRYDKEEYRKYGFVTNIKSLDELQAGTSVRRASNG